MNQLFTVSPEEMYDRLAYGEITLQEFLAWLDYREAAVFGVALGEPDLSHLT